MKHVLTWSDHHLLPALKVLQANGAPLAVFFIVNMIRIHGSVSVVQVDSVCYSFRIRIVELPLQIFQGLVLLSAGTWSLVAFFRLSERQLPSVNWPRRGDLSRQRIGFSRQLVIKDYNLKRGALWCWETAKCLVMDTSRLEGEMKQIKSNLIRT